ncbi:MAG: hypothetical protein H0U27_01095 [Nitrosopumilus sp.]|nr:hypothetical protein [Nitrosopumilus sp.]
MSNAVWCNELEKFLTSEDVWQLRFGQQPIQTDLTFACPDDCCRVRLVTRNCHRVRAPYEARFRLYQGERHQAHCVYAKALRTQAQKKPRQYMQYANI